MPVSTCPLTNELCLKAEICTRINQPLNGVLGTIRRALVHGEHEKYVRRTLKNAIQTQSDLVQVDFPYDMDSQGNGTVCPTPMLKGEFAQNYGKIAAATALINILDRTVIEVTEDLKGRQA